MQRRITQHYVLAIAFALILFSSCAKDFVSNGRNGSSDTNINEAKAIFESTATDLREIDFQLSLGQKSTKSTNTKSVITPEWSKPFVVRTDKFTIFEVPLGGDVKKYASTQYRKDGIIQRNEMEKVKTKLILKKNNETDEYIYFIATMVGRNEDRSVKEINYTNNRSFTGHIFISDLNGLWVGSYKCSSGVRQSLKMNLNNYKSSSDAPKDGVSIKMVATPLAAYRAGEGYCDRNPQCTECLYGGALCGVCYYCHIDFGDVVVTPDRCSSCNQYPCQCYPDYGCSYCGSPYCNGGCQTSCYYCGSRSCSGSCQSTGGSGGSGGSGSGGTTNPPTDPNLSHPDYAKGKAATEKIVTDLENGKADIKQLKVNPSTGEALLYAAGVGVNVNSVAPSIVSMVKKLSSTTLKNYGTGLGVAGVILGGTQTVIALVDEDGAKMSTGEILNAISTGLTAVGLLTPYFVGIPVLAAITGVAGVAGAIVGIVASAYTSEAMIIKIQLSNGGSIMLHIPASAPSPLIC